MYRSSITPRQLRLVYGLGAFILFVLFAADLAQTRIQLLQDVENNLENSTYLLAEFLGDEPEVTSETVVEILNNIRLEPRSRLTVLDTSFQIIAEYPAVVDSAPLMRLTQEEMLEMTSEDHTHPLRSLESASGKVWLVKLNHIENQPYFVVMSASQSYALKTFYQRFAIYLFLLILAIVAGYVLMSVQLRLLRSENRFRTMIDDFSDIPIQGFTPNGTIVYWNKASVEMYGYTEQEIIGKPIQDLIRSAENLERFNHILETSVRTQESAKPIHWTLSNKDGNEVDAVTYFTLLTDASGTHEIFCLDVDVTPLVEAQHRIQDLLDEKEVILKEVHHRIKNNMNTIAGMLWLQADSMKDKNAAQALIDAQGRIMNMMILYNKLFRSAHFSTLSLKEFIEDMMTHIRGTQDPSSRIEIGMTIVDAQIDSKKLQTIGMMVNELMSNVYKYAFPGGAKGRVTLSMTFPTPDMLLLELSDSGIGLPESILNNSDADGFGMMLIRMLSEQLEANLEIRNDNGASFSFRIPI